MISSDPRQKLEKLSEKQLKILSLFCDDLEYKEIGQQLGYTENTIKTYMREIRLELNIEASSPRKIRAELRNKYCPHVRHVLSIIGDGKPKPSPEIAAAHTRQLQKWAKMMLVGVVVLVVVILMGVLSPRKFDVLWGSPESTRHDPNPISEEIAIGTFTFTSGHIQQEMGRQEIPIGQLQPGKFTLILQNALPDHSGTWLVWDYLALESNQNLIWEIGNSDAPPDYTNSAFAEFCDPVQRNDCTAEFFVGITDMGDFVNVLNDFDFTTEQIHFEITEQQANWDLILILSTLFATHDDVESFQMKISLVGR